LNQPSEEISANAFKKATGVTSVIPKQKIYLTDNHLSLSTKN